MAQPTEPRVEQLLATIRRAIDRDIEDLDAREVPPVPHKLAPALRGPVMDETPESSPQTDVISNLRARVGSRRAADPVEPQAEPYGAWVEGDEGQPEQGQVEDMPPEPEGLMSPEAAFAAQNSFAELASQFVDDMGNRGQLEAMTREMLQPMLREWLDQNLPGMVEYFVREEIARVTRRR